MNEAGAGYEASTANNHSGFTAHPDGFGMINADGAYEYRGVGQWAIFWQGWSLWGTGLDIYYDGYPSPNDNRYVNLFYSIRCVREY